MGCTTAMDTDGTQAKASQQLQVETRTGTQYLTVWNAPPICPECKHQSSSTTNKTAIERSLEESKDMEKTETLELGDAHPLRPKKPWEGDRFFTIHNPALKQR